MRSSRTWMLHADDDDVPVNKHCILKLYSPGLDYINLIAFWPIYIRFDQPTELCCQLTGHSYMFGSEHKPLNIELSWEWKWNRSKTLITQTHLEIGSNRLNLSVSSCEASQSNQSHSQSDNQSANPSTFRRINCRYPTLWETSLAPVKRSMTPMTQDRTKLSQKRQSRPHTCQSQYHRSTRLSGRDPRTRQQWPAAVKAE